MFTCGALLGLTYATRGLTALAIPCFLLAAWFGARDLPAGSRSQHVIALISGLVVSVVVFAIVWLIPHYSEITRVNHYYIVELLLPRSLPRLFLNVERGFFDYHRGAMPYLMRHSPVQFSLACAGLGWAAITRAGRHATGESAGAPPLDRSGRAVLALAATWMAIYCGFLCCVSYAPSRYYVLFYPAMAALAALSLFEAPRIADEIIDNKLLAALLGSFLLCLAGQVLRSRLALIDVTGMHALFWALALAFLIGSRVQRGAPGAARRRYGAGPLPPEIWITSLAVWAIVNCYWTGDWLLHLTYRQRHADRWLGANLPPNSTLIGAVAPGLCLNNRLHAVSVIQDLCNDGAVFEDLPPPRFIAILDGPKWRERWWQERYPDLIAPRRLVHVFRGLLRPSFEVGVYAVDPPNGPRAHPLYLTR
jgi:hypothetical protein